MLQQAMDSYQLLKRDHSENQKAQYTDKTKGAGKKNFFRASELGNGDRKIIYGLFGHQLPKIPKSALNLRQLENGDKVHERYQSAWENMGILISMEERLSSKDDEYLAEFPFEWAGHYDGVLDAYLMRAFALGKVTVSSSKNEETGEWDLDVEVDEAYANAIGLFDADGNIAEDYNPPTILADIKTMNPWGFKAIKDKGDLSKIVGYLDQISFYMYMKNTPYGSIFIESKENNETVEVQVLWRDMHEGVTYEWDEDIHGKNDGTVVRAVIDSDRFFGSEKVEGCVPRLDRLWSIKVALEEAQEAGDMQRIAELMPDKCEGVTSRDSFPCSWGHKKNNIQYCEFFDHCWNPATDGRAITKFEECPSEFVWEFEGEQEGEIVRIDSRKVPKGVDEDGFLQLVGMGALDYTKFLVATSTVIAVEPEIQEEQHESALNADNLFSSTGELKIGAPPSEGIPTEATEYITEDGKKAIDCLNCGKQNTYQKLATGGTKKCAHCKHTNRVVR